MEASARSRRPGREGKLYTLPVSHHALILLLYLFLKPLSPGMLRAPGMGAWQIMKLYRGCRAPGVTLCRRPSVTSSPSRSTWVCSSHLESLGRNERV